MGLKVPGVALAIQGRVCVLQDISDVDSGPLGCSLRAPVSCSLPRMPPAAVQKKDCEALQQCLEPHFPFCSWNCSEAKLGYSGTAILSKVRRRPGRGSWNRMK